MKFEMHCEVQGLSKRGLVFGDNVTIGNSAMIRPSSYYGVEVGEGLKMGNNSSIGPMSYIGCAGYINIGSNVMIGPRVSFLQRIIILMIPQAQLNHRELLEKE
ncbi:hypothetical protein [Clostridium sp. OS1-26]|uniref:acyltransferase n=1 Tax=Clostridium sp. OS1-26 TaxID=3070681 RepID=UPI0027DEC013|nr:hypothetical protein [Clostridium sp. OS1-26]WML36795.1 hypothetical protein RCG18_09305 [Clostridium sp. OS1-26]